MFDLRGHLHAQLIVDTRFHVNIFNITSNVGWLKVLHKIKYTLYQT